MAFFRKNLRLQNLFTHRGGGSFFGPYPPRQKKTAFFSPSPHEATLAVCCVPYAREALTHIHHTHHSYHSQREQSVPSSSLLPLDRLVTQ